MPKRDIILALVGAVLILLASGIYATVPPHLVLPVGSWRDWTALQSETQAFQGNVERAGRIALVGDLALILGAIGLARAGQGALFWRATALGTALFVPYDIIATVALADPTLGNDIYMPLRRIFDLSFVLGILTLAIGCISLPIARPMLRRALQVPAALAGLTSLAYFVAPVPPQVFGLFIFAGLVLLIALLVGLWRRPPQGI